VDLIAEIRLMQTSQMLTVIIGKDIADMEIKIVRNGVQKQVPIGYALIQVFEDLIMRMVSPHVVFFPTLLANKLWFTPYERECAHNSAAIRNLIRGILRER
jgi:hypothetical protein